MILEDLKINFIQHLLEIVPKGYILHHYWRSIQDWETYYNAQTDMKFELAFMNSYPVYKEPICIWESPQTRIYQVYQSVEDISDWENQYKSQLENTFTTTEIDCHIGLNFGKNYEEGTQILTLSIRKISFFEMGISYIIDELPHSYQTKLDDWYLLSNTSQWCFYRAGLKDLIFTNFELIGLNESTKYNRSALSCINEMKTFLSPIWKLSNKSIFSKHRTIIENLSIWVEGMMGDLKKTYVKSTVPTEEYGELSENLYFIIQQLELLVNRYGHIILDLKVHYYNLYTRKHKYLDFCRLDQYVAQELRDWHSTFEDPMTLWNDAYDKCNQIAFDLEYEWFFRDEYKIKAPEEN